MKAKALHTFRTRKPGDSEAMLVSPGDVFVSTEEHIRALVRNRLVEPMEESEEEAAPKQGVAKKSTKNSKPEQATEGA